MEEMVKCRLKHSHGSVIFEGEVSEKLEYRFHQSRTLKQAIQQGVNLSHINLHGSYLIMQKLVGVDLSYATMNDAFLYKAVLDDADLTYTSLEDANLVQASLKGAKLNNAFLTNADLSLANLKNSDLRDARLNCANLSFAKFDDADLRGVNFRAAEFRFTHFNRANLSGVSFLKLKMHHTDFRAANLTNTNFNLADLRNSQLDDADLSNAAVRSLRLAGTSLKGAKLDGVNLRNADLVDIRSDFFEILLRIPHEIEPLRLALIEGRIKGPDQGVYRGLFGIIRHMRGCSLEDLFDRNNELSQNKGLLEYTDDRPVEAWFAGIGEGDTPENNQISAITVEWIDEFLELCQKIQFVRGNWIFRLLTRFVSFFR